MSTPVVNPLSENYPYDLFFDLSPDLLCIAGFDGFFKKVNQAVINLLGYSAEELYAKPINEFVYEKDKEITSMARTSLINRQPLLHFENRYLTKNGTIVWLSWTSMPIEMNEVIFAIAKDITDKKRLEEDRNKMLIQLSALNKELKQLTYTTSHDLRSPVNNLLSVFSLIDRSRIEDQETASLLEILKTCSEGIKDTLNGYIDTLTVSEQKNNPLQTIDFKECLDNVLGSVNALVQSSKTIFKIDFSQAEKIKFNRAYLESIFLNLITNSIKYARPGVPPVITIYTSVVNGYGQLVVSDNGLGFDMENAKNKLFGLHQTFHQHADSKGIGLYLVYNHVTGLGGKITAESEVNKGSAFTITFNSSV